MKNVITQKVQRTVNGQKTDNSDILVNGCKVGVIGKPYINASYYVFFSHDEEFDALAYQLTFSNKKAFMETIKKYVAD